ncbi:MAG: hypothetical protein KDD83_28675, partial [Caldilineaceae bacterium]|nr:hypothetical protein [Caldilineaceae bacterium]
MDKADNARGHTAPRPHGPFTHAGRMALLVLALLLGAACTAPGAFPQLTASTAGNSPHIVATDAGHVAGVAEDG